MATKTAKLKLPKAPKAPKKSAGLATWERYDQRVKDWEKKCKDKVSDHNKRAQKKESDKKRKESLIAGVTKRKTIKKR